jgi:hypothetical protein
MAGLNNWLSHIRALADRCAFDCVLLDLAVRAVSLTSSCTMLLALVLAPELVTAQFASGSCARLPIILSLLPVPVGGAVGFAHGLAKRPRHGVIGTIASCGLAWPLIALGWWGLLRAG